MEEKEKRYRVTAKVTHELQIIVPASPDQYGAVGIKQAKGLNA
jgi:hypothetical protein